MSQTEYEIAIAEFIRSKGITRCPTVCLAPTQGSVGVTDQMTLQRRAEHLEELRQEKLRSKQSMSASMAFRSVLR
jgi:hypothetical protein